MDFLSPFSPLSSGYYLSLFVEIHSSPGFYSTILFQFEDFLPAPLFLSTPNSKTSWTLCSLHTVPWWPHPVSPWWVISAVLPCWHVHVLTQKGRSDSSPFHLGFLLCLQICFAGTVLGPSASFPGIFQDLIRSKVIKFQTYLKLTFTYKFSNKRYVLTVSLKGYLKSSFGAIRCYE